MALKTYVADKVKIQHNRKTGEAGTIDLHRGCPGCELRKAPCYAAKGAARVGIDFFHPVARTYDEKLLSKQLKAYKPDWLRIGCISDPSLDWELATKVCKLAHEHGKTPVIVTKMHRTITKGQLDSLAKSQAILQVSVSGMAQRRRLYERLDLAILARSHGIRAVVRVNSMAFPDPPKGTLIDDTRKWPAVEQSNAICFAFGNKLPILETPVRLFQTSPIWNLVDQSQYHRHLSPISGKLDNQRTAGLLIKGPRVYPCFSSCSPTPTDTDPVGCENQCLTQIDW